MLLEKVNENFFELLLVFFTTFLISVVVSAVVVFLFLLLWVVDTLKLCSKLFCFKKYSQYLYWRTHLTIRIIRCFLFLSKKKKKKNKNQILNYVLGLFSFVLFCIWKIQKKKNKTKIRNSVEKRDKISAYKQVVFGNTNHNSYWLGFVSLFYAFACWLP